MSDKLKHGLSMGGGIVLNLSDVFMKNVKCLVSDAPNISIEVFCGTLPSGSISTAISKCLSGCCSATARNLVWMHGNIMAHSGLAAACNRCC